MLNRAKSRSKEASAAVLDGQRGQVSIDHETPCNLVFDTHRLKDLDVSLPGLDPLIPGLAYDRTE